LLFDPPDQQPVVERSDIGHMSSPCLVSGAPRHRHPLAVS
jgi:hypothetical protein